MQQLIRVLVVDDHPLLRQGLISVMKKDSRIMVLGEARDGMAAISKAEKLQPDVVLMDIFMPVMTGLEAAYTIRQRLPQTKILFLTISDKEADLFTALRMGAHGYLLKNVDPDKFIEAIVGVAAGEAIISPMMADKMLKEEFPSEGKAIQSDLTAREREVLEHLAKGESNKEIANTLFVSENTVKTHLKNILDKLHLKNRSQAAAYFARLHTA